MAQDNLSTIRPNIYVNVTNSSDTKLLFEKEHSLNESIATFGEINPKQLASPSDYSHSSMNAYVTISGQMKLIATPSHQSQITSPTSFIDAAMAERSISSGDSIPLQITEEKLDLSASSDGSKRTKTRIDNHHGAMSVCTLNSSFDGLRNINDMNAIIHHPLSAGFLFNFCASQYCAENIKFIIEVDKFRDFLHQDSAAFPAKPWKVLDKDLRLPSSIKLSAPNTPENKGFTIKGKTGNLVKTTSDAQEIQELIDNETLIPESTWRSIKVDRIVVFNMVKRIWEQFLSDEAEDQICMPSKVLEHTCFRLKNIHIYGAQVFQECLLDPVKTIMRDIKPRFMVSSTMRDLKLRLEDLMELPCASSLRVQPPPPTAHLKYTTAQLKSPNFGFSIDDMLNDRLCYSKFMKYLNHIVCSENLRFLRLVQLFKQKYRSGNNADKPQMLPPINTSSKSPSKGSNDEATEIAWQLLLYFIAPTSSYEISISHTDRREIMRHMASPTVAMFDKIEKSTMNILLVHYNNFTNTNDYKQLAAALLSEIPQRKKDAIQARKNNNRNNVGTNIGCFGKS